MKNAASKTLLKVSSLLLTVIIAAGYFISGGIDVSADVGQPELPVPALSDIHCASYCVYDKTTDMIVISQNMDDKIYPASQTKIMTCMLSLDYLDTDAKLTVSESAMASIGSDSSVMGIGVGEKVKVSELLYGLMLPSGNDAANVLAEGCVDAFFNLYPEGGTQVNKDGVTAQYLLDTLGDTKENILAGRKIEAFAALMNLRAQTLGLSGTHFVNACGLHDENHYTTAHDLALMMSAASEYDDFRKLISSPTHIFQATNLHTSDAWSYVKNSDYLLFDPWLAGKTANGTDSHLAAIIGGKTGTTSNAGKGVTIYTVNENGHKLMVSICGIPAEYYFYTTMYLASVTAYGNLACWENDPESVVIGTTGDYRSVNAPDSEQPEYDPLIYPGDQLVDYFPDTPTPTEAAAPDTGDATQDNAAKQSAPLVLFIKDNTKLSVLIGTVMLAIIIINGILIIRVTKLSRPRRRRSKMQGRG